MSFGRSDFWGYRGACTITAGGDKIFTQTIVEVPVDPAHALKSILADVHPATSVVPDGAVARRLFTIRAADSFGQRSLASILVNRMYATRGYHTSSLLKSPDSNRITLIAGEADAVIGTITIGFDSPQGLLVDELFRAETDALRHAGRELCEFTKLAMDSIVKSKRVLASLFHVAYIIAHRLNDFDNLMIEVNPRHVLYYQRMLGFEVLGPERLNQRVNAPAVLLSLDLSHARREIEEFGGRQDLAAREKSLYPYFFSPGEEGGIIKRLM